MNLQQINEKIQNLNPHQAFRELVEDNPKKFTDFLRKQWKTGKHGENVTFEYRSKKYSEEKFQQNPEASGLVDLILTGDTAESIYFNISESSNGAEIEFKGEGHADELTKKYGSLIWIFNDDTIDLAVEFLRKEYINYLI